MWLQLLTAKNLVQTKPIFELILRIYLLLQKYEDLKKYVKSYASQKILRQAV